MNDENTAIEEEQQGAPSVIMSIAQELSCGEPSKPGYLTQGEYAQDLLTDICNNIATLFDLTEQKVNPEFLLSIMGSYLISCKHGTIDEDAVAPAALFDTTLFPYLHTINTDVAVEEITYDDEQ